MLLAVADRAAENNILVFNAGATDDALRMEQCRANVIHVAPSRTMLADALAQYLVRKNWTRWFLIVGSHPADEEYAAAIRRAQRFGAEIVEERVFEDTGGARTTDSGLAQVDPQMAVFTQDAADHHVVVVADESEVFGPYVPYHTWSPAPVAGTDGLRPTSWAPSHDQWGAIQMQNRFVEGQLRLMTDKDIESWTAVRIIGEAATRTGSTDPATITEFIKGPDFEIAAFKGVPLTLARLGSSTQAADPARRWADGRLGFAAGGVPAPDLDARYARLRQTGDAVPVLKAQEDATETEKTRDEADCRSAPGAVALRAGPCLCL